MNDLSAVKFIGVRLQIVLQDTRIKFMIMTILVANSLNVRIEQYTDTYIHTKTPARTGRHVLATMSIQNARDSIVEITLVGRFQLQIRDSVSSIFKT